jgi:hypothetical protein
MPEPEYSTDVLLQMMLEKNRSAEKALRKQGGAIVDPWAVINDRLDLLVRVVFPHDTQRQEFELACQKMLYDRLEAGLRQARIAQITSGTSSSNSPSTQKRLIV